jgi:predicted Holliday junction resolvase-like endonuclease
MGFIVLAIFVWLVYRYFKVKKYRQAFERTKDTIDNNGYGHIEQLQYDIERRQNILNLMELRENGVLNKEEFSEKLQSIRGIDEEMRKKFADGLNEEQLEQLLKDNRILQENKLL